MKRILIPILLLAVLALGRTADPVLVPSGRAFETVRHNINNLTMVITNKGTFGQDESGNNGGLFWRYSGYAPTNYYIYGAGPWFGTITGEGDTLVTIGYGPSGGQFEYGCGLAGMSVSHPDAIIYFYPTPWPPPSETYPMAPQTYKSHQDSWCAMNDLDIQYHMPGDTRPIGLEVYQTVYAWNLSTTADIIFLKFDCKNVSGQTLNDCYFGVITDNDIGNEAGTAANDRCSGIVYREYLFPGDPTPIIVDDLGYQWQEVPEGGWPIFPGTIGFDYLQSPYRCEAGWDRDNDGIDDGSEQDSAYYYTYVPDSLWDADLDGTPDWRDPSQIPQWGMTSFKRFTLDLEPSRDNQRYVTMAGYNFVTGQYDPLDTVAPDPGDQRFGQCSGPFELLPDSTVTVLVGVMVTAWTEAPGAPAPPGYPLFATPDSALALVDRTAQFIFDQNWLLPGPPAPPTLTLVPGDARITLVWNTFAETFADPYYDVVGWDSLAIPPGPFNEVLYDSFYLKYDFEGYGIWKSINGLEYELLTRYDKVDNITFDDAETGIYATDGGLVHSYTDEDVRNGFTYYYAVTAFDYNYVAAETSGIVFGQPIWFESGRVGVTGVARRDPANYEPGQYTVNVVYGNPVLADSNLEITITAPLEMTADHLYLDFAPIEYDAGNARYSVEFLDRDYNLVDQFTATLAAGQDVLNEFPVYQGLSITPLFVRENIPATSSIFASVVVESGTYPDTFPAATWLVPAPMPTNWSYRGNDYRVYWRAKDAGGPVNTVTVVDVQVGDTIPYQPFLENTATMPIADGWCFRSLTLATDTLIYGTVPQGTRFLYIRGGKFKLKNLNQLAPGDPVPSANDVWLVSARVDYAAAPAYARLEIVPIPAAYADTAVALNVKVVPNPYIIANEWQQTFDQRRLRFINLPADCVIRVFTLNGDLIRMIRHVDTSEGGVAGDLGGDEWWDLLSDNRQLIASGVYIFHIQSDVGEQVGKFVLIR
jgi:hypothetical protein